MAQVLCGVGIRAGILFYLHKIPPLSGRAAAPKSEDFIESDKRKRGWEGVFYFISQISGAALRGIDPFIKYWDFWVLGFIRTDKMPGRKKPALVGIRPEANILPTQYACSLMYSVLIKVCLAPPRRYSAGSVAQVLWGVGFRAPEQLEALLGRLNASGMRTQDLSGMEVAQVGGGQVY